MTNAQRQRVAEAFHAASASHPGLLLERGLEVQADVKKKDELLKRAADAKPDVLYGLAYNRRHAALERRAAQKAELYVQDKLIVGLGGKGVMETAITLHRAYGMPLIPGSALKGLARHYAEQVLAKQDSAEAHKLDLNGDFHRILFGRQDSAGYIIYHDAWYVPGTAPDNHPFARDVVTVHHPQYYTKRGNERRPPWDFDDPNPVGFISARGAYLIAVEGPDDQWAAFAFGLLVRALADFGVGGKTAAGYGRLGPTPPALASAKPTPSTLHATAVPSQAAPPSPQAETLPASRPREQDTSTSAPSPTRPPAPTGPTMTEIEAMIANIKALMLQEAPSKLGDYVDAWRKIPEHRDYQEQRVALAWAIIDRADRTRDPKLLRKGWMSELREFLRRYPRRK